MRYALVIGNSKYDDLKLAQLKTPEADTRELAKVLRKKSIGNFDEVISLLDQTEAKTRRAISAFLANKKPDDLVLLYFSGHGVLDGRGNLFLASKDTEYDSLNATAISSSFLSYEMDVCRSRRQILILDCCNSGAFARGAKAGSQMAVTESTFEGSGSGRVVLTASDATQFAFEGDQVIPQVETKFSVFTHFLLEGLTTGKADRNRDGKISLDEWYDYCYAGVIAETPGQVPHKWSYRQQGEIIIAQNPFPPEPSEPSDLRAMLDQKQKDFQQHGLLLDSKELEILADELSRTKLELQEDDKRLILLSAVVYDDGQKWLGICGAAGVEWLRRAYQDGKLPQKVRLGAVRLLGRGGDGKTLTNLMETIERGSHSREVEQGLDFLAHYLDRSPHPLAIPRKLRRLLFPRMERLTIMSGSVERVRMRRITAILAFSCVLVTFISIFIHDGIKITTILTLLGFEVLGIGLSMLFSEVMVSILLITRKWFWLWRGIISAGIGGAFGEVLFIFLAGQPKLWFIGGAIGLASALSFQYLGNKVGRLYSVFWAVLNGFLAFVFALNTIKNPSLVIAIGAALSVSLFAAIYIYSIGQMRYPPVVNDHY